MHRIYIYENVNEGIEKKKIIKKNHFLSFLLLKSAPNNLISPNPEKSQKPANDQRETERKEEG